MPNATPQNQFTKTTSNKLAIKEAYKMCDGVVKIFATIQITELLSPTSLNPP